MDKKFVNEFTYKNFVEQGREEEFDKRFEEALEEVKREIGKNYPMYIGGEEVYTSSLIKETSPIDSRIIIGNFQKGTKEHVKTAIRIASEAFEQWSAIDYKERAKYFTKFADVLSQNKFYLAAALSIENGKSRYESIGEVDEAIDFSRYYVRELLLNKGYIRKTSISESVVKTSFGFQGAPSSAEKVSIKLKPYGVFGVIAPFNFPISISVGMSVAAMITGNTVIFKPSSTDNMAMLSGINIYKMLEKAGIPKGVFNIVTGPGSEVGEELVTNKGVDGIVFTGSRTTGMNMIAKTYTAGLQKVFITEMGGKNAAIVSKSADVDVAVSGIVSSAFGFAGQKCSALSRIYVHESVKELVISKIIERMRELKIGDPIKKEVFIGPLISESAYKRYKSVINEIKQSGRLLYGGDNIDCGLSGFYVEPVLAELRQNHELVHKELFLPVLIVIGFKEFSEAIKMSNDIEYGLTSGLYSKNKGEIAEYSKNIEDGVIYINRKVGATTGAIVGLHTFVGWKGSGITGKGTGSIFYLQQFMREQSISITK